MDYELVIDLTDANTQAYVTNLSQIFSNLLGPSFDIHERNKYFTSISIKCNLNIPQLPDAKILPSLQDLNNKTNTAIGNSLIKLKGPIQRPSLQTCLKRHRLKNKYHHKRLLNSNHNTSSSSSSPNSSPLILPSSSSSRRNKKRTFVSNNRLISEEPEKKKKSFLPPPKIPHVPSQPAPPKQQQPPPPRPQQSPPPPSYTDVIAQERNHNNHHNHHNHHHFGLSDKQWQIQFDLLNPNEEEEGKKEEIVQEEEEEEEEELKQDAAIRVSQEDEDLALALRLQEEQQNIDDDMKIALQLQKEEEMRAKQQRARVHRYRNPNFVDFGSHPGDIPDIFGRIMSEDTENIHDIHDHDADDILSAFSIHNGLYLNEFHRHHQGSSSSSASSSFTADDSWQRLPVHTLKAKDVEILRKSQEKKSCPICMTDFVVNDVTRQLPCFHTFHKDCIDKWFHQQNDKGKDASCPLDRKKIKDIANQHV